MKHSLCCGNFAPRVSLVERNGSEKSSGVGRALPTTIICCRGSFATLDHCRSTLSENSDNLFSGDS